MKKTTILIIFFITLSICFISSYLYIQNAKLFVDEKFHYSQIKKFINKDFTHHPKITTIPGYHAILALFAYIFNVSSIAPIRLLSLFFSIASIPIFFLSSLKICEESSMIKTMQYYFFPILFPFFFLLYTDVSSLLMILISFYFLLNQKYKLAGIMGILSLFIRQNNIVWLAFMCVFIHFEKYNFEFSAKIFQKSIRDYWIFIIGFILFTIFLIINKGVAIGQKSMHPSFLFRTGNIFFMMFLFFFLFLPLNISNFQKIVQHIEKNKKIIIIIAIVFLIYMFTFVNDHPYNWSGYFIRNKILIYFTSTIVLKTLFFIPIAYSILSISVTKLHRKSFYILYPATLIYLLPSWLIEQRYYLIPFILFILFKKEESKFVEYLTITFYVLASTGIYLGIRNNFFFL